MQISPGFGSANFGHCFLIWCRKMWIKNVQHSFRILGFALRSTPSLHLHFIIHLVLFILCLLELFHLIIPVAFIIYLFIKSLTYLYEPCTVRYKLFYSSISRWQLVIPLGYLFYVRPFRVLCVMFANNSNTRCMCEIWYDCVL